jgi:hypothetical protein
LDWVGDCGKTIDAVSGEAYKIPIFAASFPYSAALFAKAYPDMKQASFLAGHMDAFEYFGGVPSILVPDNCKTAANRATIYLTEINETYWEFATYYQTAIVPARVRKPQDKAAVESAVLLIERNILAPLRDERFFSIAELNRAIRERIDSINKAPFQKREGCRWSVFENEEQEHLKDLPSTRFEIAQYKVAKVSVDYHIQIDTMRYSVPYKYIGEKLDVRTTSKEITISKAGSTVASHLRLYGRRGQCSTNKEHMPPAHQRYDQTWSPARFTSWAERIGPSTLKAIQALLDSKEIVEQAYVPALNILNLGRKGKRELLEAACADFMSRSYTPPTYSALKNIMTALAASQDIAVMPLETSQYADSVQDSGLVRGASYYSKDRGEDSNRD